MVGTRPATVVRKSPVSGVRLRGIHVLEAHYIYIYLLVVRVSVDGM